MQTKTVLNEVQEIDVVDMFCGAGGTSTGVIEAAEKMGIAMSLIAINHWDVAILTHSTNHPKMKHYNSDLISIDPHAAVPSGKLKLLVASPECTHFSRARAGSQADWECRSGKTSKSPGDRRPDLTPESPTFRPVSLQNGAFLL